MGLQMKLRVLWSDYTKNKIADTSHFTIEQNTKSPTTDTNLR